MDLAALKDLASPLYPPNSTLSRHGPLLLYSSVLEDTTWSVSLWLSKRDGTIGTIWEGEWSRTKLAAQVTTVPESGIVAFLRTCFDKDDIALKAFNAIDQPHVDIAFGHGAGTPIPVRLLRVEPDAKTSNDLVSVAAKMAADLKKLGKDSSATPELLRLQNENAMLKKNFAAAKREVDRLKKTVASNSSRSTYGVSSVSQASSSKTVPLPSSSQGSSAAVGANTRASGARPPPPPITHNLGNPGKKKRKVTSNDFQDPDSD